MVEGKVVTGQGLQPMGLWDILMAPIRGFVKAGSWLLRIRLEASCTS